MSKELESIPVSLIRVKFKVSFLQCHNKVDGKRCDTWIQVNRIKNEKGEKVVRYSCPKCKKKGERTLKPKQIATFKES